jgi:hypothetical protein
MIELDSIYYKNDSATLVWNLTFFLERLWKCKVETEKGLSQENMSKIFSLTKLTESHLALALIYTARLVERQEEISLEQPFMLEYKYFIICLILSSKYLDDITYKNKSWAFISGIPLVEVNQLEQNVLGILNYSLHVEKEVFSQQKSEILRSCKTKKTFQIYNTAEEGEISSSATLVQKKNFLFSKIFSSFS